eukprot:TRINITY_DN56913_c0_g1_i1.p1 TRINITY_DN56913_c0_g1~~TRINITY_DN56913_c0_g1_i1.p1  ORF type:complete len:168 (-),score=27.13 TRINITY_DN56913_c0_g1_i1:21-488(-)
MYRGFDGTGLDGQKPVRKAKINGEDGVYVGSQGYVPRLVQVDLPWQRPPSSGGVKRLSQKAPTKGSLRTLGADCYAPSGIALRPDDLIDQRGKMMPGSKSVPLGGAGKFDSSRPTAVFDSVSDAADRVARSAAEARRPGGGPAEVSRGYDISHFR